MPYSRSQFGTDFKAIDQAFILDGMTVNATYQRDGDTISLAVVLDGVTTGYDDRAGIDVAIGDASFWILADALDFGSGPVQPKMHDKITTADGESFEVLEPGRLDSERIMWRVPVIRVVYQP